MENTIDNIHIFVYEFERMLKAKTKRYKWSIELLKLMKDYDFDRLERLIHEGELLSELSDYEEEAREACRRYVDGGKSEEEAESAVYQDLMCDFDIADRNNEFLDMYDKFVSRSLEGKDLERFEFEKKRLLLEIKEMCPDYYDQKLVPDDFVVNGVGVTLCILRKGYLSFERYAEAMQERFGKSVFYFLGLFYNIARDINELGELAPLMNTSEEVAKFQVGL